MKSKSSPAQTLQSSKIFSSYDPQRQSLPELSLQLLDQQRRTWSQLAQGYDSLRAVRLRELQCNGFRAFLQFNAGRIASTAARVDEESIKQRRCFLCVENLPPAQKGILYKDEFLVLCNPAPIVTGHYTISHVSHVPQALEPFLNLFLSVAKDLSPKLTVFYNGPRSGASAPDHLHFQASPTGGIPVEWDAWDPVRRVSLKQTDGVTVFTLANYGRQVLVLESPDQDRLAHAFVRILNAMRTVGRATAEPMINVLCSHDGRTWRVILFPRSKHRPAVYSRDGAERVLISPAAVDMGGLVITPLEKDFNFVDEKLLEEIFCEVSVGEETMEGILAAAFSRNH